MRIQKNKLYLKATTPGLSGFQRWDNLELRIISGTMAQDCKLEIAAEIIGPLPKENYRLENGRVPECQPVISSKEIRETISRNPHNAIFWKEIKTSGLVSVLESTALIKNSGKYKELPLHRLLEKC